MKKLSGFSLMEMMVVLTIVAIIAAVSAPMVNKRMLSSAERTSPWIFTGTGDNIAFDLGNKNKSATIGWDNPPNDSGSPKLYINSDTTKPQIAFGFDKKLVSKLFVDSAKLTLGKKDFNGNTGLVVLGDCNEASDYSVAIGHETKAAKRGISVGYGAEATAEGAIAIGGADTTTTSGPKATKSGAIAIGIGANASGTNSTAIGVGAKASHDYSTAIGNGATTSASNTIVLGDANTTVIIPGKLEVASKTTLKDELEVEKATTLKNTLNVSEKTTLQKELEVKNATTLQGTLTANARATFNKAMTINGGDDTPAVINDDFIVNSRAHFDCDAGPNFAGVNITHGLNVSDGFYVSNGPTVMFLEQYNGGNNKSVELRWSSGGNYIRYMDSDLYNLYSDRRLKNIGKAFTAGLEEIKKLDVFNYTFKNDEAKTPRVGVIAQDLQKIFPQAVFKGEDGFLRIRMEDMFYALVNAVKELDAKIEGFKNNEILTLKNRIDDLEEQNKELIKANKKFEKRLEALEKSLKNS